MKKWKNGNSYQWFRHQNEIQMAKDPADSEKQLARALNIAIKKKAKIIGVMLNSNEKRIDTGTPESYAKMLLDYRKILKNGKKFI